LNSHGLAVDRIGDPDRDLERQRAVEEVDGVHVAGVERLVGREPRRGVGVDVRQGRQGRQQEREEREERLEPAHCATPPL
jgi:hypothetical protein